MIGVVGEVVFFELLLFFNELQNLCFKLELFFNVCLVDNFYLECFFLCGLFFFSGLQEGGVVLLLFGQVLFFVVLYLNIYVGLFLYDFFGCILLQDCFVFCFVELVNCWWQVIWNLGVVVWIFIVLVVGIMIMVFFVFNMEMLLLVCEKWLFDV